MDGEIINDTDGEPIWTDFVVEFSVSPALIAGSPTGAAVVDGQVLTVSPALLGGAASVGAAQTTTPPRRGGSGTKPRRGRKVHLVETVEPEPPQVSIPARVKGAVLTVKPRLIAGTATGTATIAAQLITAKPGDYIDPVKADNDWLHFAA